MLEKPICQICNKQDHSVFICIVLKYVLNGKTPSQFPSNSPTIHVAFSDVSPQSGCNWLLDFNASHLRLLVYQISLLTIALKVLLLEMMINFLSLVLD